MSLEVLWFLIWGFLWMMYFATDGFVLGVGTLYPFIARTDTDRRILLNTVGPVWDGNEVWLITVGAVTFGAFPLVYAVLFTSLYSALMLILFALIIRGVCFEFRSKVESEGWRKVWDVAIPSTSAVTAFLFGVVFANIFAGIAIGADGAFSGSFFGLLNVYGLLGGLVFVTLFIQHGLSWLTIKTEGALNERVTRLALRTWLVAGVALLLFVVLSAFSTPLFDNFVERPVLFVIPLLAVAALILHRVFLGGDRPFAAWFASAAVIAGAAWFGLAGMFPRLLPSSIDDGYSLTLANSAAEPLTLKLMLGVLAIFVPLILVYQSYAYYLFRLPVTDRDMESEEAY